ncbi:MAG: motility associated factor glycosyltransferase family protein [Leptospiraceae bacterium]|nr:motility associated factor glycosyltransferase family protein [Leptospiraceae bacterium]
MEEELSSVILNSDSIGTLFPTKSGVPTLKIDEIYFHSKYDPIKEARRLMADLKDSEIEKVYIFFGAGLGYLVRDVLENKKGIAVWMEYYPSILKRALALYDYSRYFKEDRFKILFSPFTEETLFQNFKGLASHPVTFISHRGSFLWRESEYSKLKFICEKFFKKKDVNIATLTKFEKLWTRNIIQNIPELISMKPVSELFGKAKGLPFVVCGAGPSLFYDLQWITKYRECFILVCVDTSLHILSQNGIEPDIIYSVDPQALNSYYLQGYEGNGVLVFDPTSTYHTLRLSEKLKKAFFSSSPFPLINILKKHSKTEIGDIKFGGSVSTNAVDFAELMGAEKVYFVGQDLAFTEGYAHCRGAVLEERLNFKETRYFRREKHNFKQLTALPKMYTKGYDGKIHQTNEKMLIFKKWFSDSHNNKWINLTFTGAEIEGIPQATFANSFENTPNETKKEIQNAREFIKQFANKPTQEYIHLPNLTEEMYGTIEELSSFEKVLLEGLEISQKIYTVILQNREENRDFKNLLIKMDKIDTEVSARENLSLMISSSLQRVILSITEGYDTNLTVEEKANKRLGIAKKSVLLYNGLLESTRLNRKLLKKAYYRI